MSKLFGGRWRNRGNIGGGGQGDVFRVTDESGDLSAEFALKRLRDLSRLDRFKNEIAALRRLDHPRIVRLIDHSDLLKESTEPHFLVMPLASEGDAERRLSLFTGNIENVLLVALQAAEALAAAHQANVVHRDVKPGNILFPSQGLDIWLSDFGICHLEKDIRDTPPGAVMGPRRYAAPEIEEGISDVPSNVDVYSLGQVIFYLLSNGRTFHRENVHSPDHNEQFPAGERSDMLRVLLGRMVAPRERRIEMYEVVAQLQRLKEWTSLARGSVLDDEARHLILGMRKKLQKDVQDKADAAKVKADQDAIKAAGEAGIVSVIKRALDQAAVEISDGGDFSAGTSEEFVARGVRAGATMYRIISAVRLSVSVASISKQYEFYFLFCEKKVTRVQIVAPGSRSFINNNDPIFAMIPIFSINQLGSSKPEIFSVYDGRRFPLKMMGPDLTFESLNRFPASSVINAPTFAKIETPEFRLSDWPAVEADVRNTASEFLKVFLRDVLLQK